MATAAALKKQVERAEARERYIQEAQVELYGDHAIVVSEFNAEQCYRVEIEDGGPVACQCPDFEWGTKKNPLHQCKHQKAVKRAMAAEMDAIVAQLEKDFGLVEIPKKAKKVRRSAPNEALIAELGAKVTKKVTIAQVRRAMSKSAVIVSSVCPENATQAA